MTAASILSGWWKAIAGFVLAIMGFLALRRRKPPATPPAGQQGVQEAFERHDDRVQDADDRLVDELLKPGDERYEAAAAYLRNRKKGGTP